MKQLSALAFCAVVAAGCAHLQFETDYPKGGETNWLGQTLDGVHYRRPVPYLWVLLNDKSPPACVPQIVYLPDADHDSVIIPRQGLGTLSMKPQLSDGWNLTALDSQVDSKIPETITAISSLAGAATKAAGLGTASVQLGALVPPGAYSPGLYKLNLSTSGDTLVPVFTVGNTICSGLTVAPKTAAGAAERPK